MMGVSFKDSSCALFDISCNDSALVEYSSRSNGFVKDRKYGCVIPSVSWPESDAHVHYHLKLAHT